MQPARVELLQRMPIFGALREDALELLLHDAPTVTVAAGGYFFREGEAADSMFVLEAGRVVVVKSWQQREYVLHSLAGGDCFGEMALMDFGPRSASVRACEDCRAIELAAAAFLALFEADAEQFALLQMNIGREVCRRLRAADDWLFRAMMGEQLPGPEPFIDRAAATPPGP